MNVYMAPLISGEIVFMFVLVLGMTVAGVAIYDESERSVWRARIPPKVTIGFGIVMASLLTSIQIDEARLHFRARRMDCQRHEGPVLVRFRGGRIPTVDLVVAEHTFTMQRHSVDTSRIVNSLGRASSSRRYVVCVDSSGQVLRIDRARR